jgi:hypothetical protein
MFPNRHKLKVLGLAPDEYIVPGTRVARITQEADAAWEERMRVLGRGEAARLESERRRTLAAAAGKAAAASPRHISKRARSARRGRR